MILPAAPSLEKEGTFTNTERRVQRLYQVLPTLGESKADWEILQAVARRLEQIGSIIIQATFSMK